MTIEKESVLKAKVIAYLRSSGWFVFKTNDRARHGTLDLYALKKGVSVWIELKRVGEAVCMVSPQGREITAIREHGGIAIVIHSIDELECWIKRIIGGSND